MKSREDITLYIFFVSHTNWPNCYNSLLFPNNFHPIFFHLSEAIYYTVPLLLCIFPVPYTNRLEAAGLYEEALSAAEKILEKNHPKIAMNYDILAGLYKEQGKYKASEQLYKKALAIEEKILIKGFHLCHTAPCSSLLLPVP